MNIHTLPACTLCHLGHIWLLVTLWTVVLQAPLSMGFSRREYFSELPCPTPGDLPNPEIEHASLTTPAMTIRFFTTSATLETPNIHTLLLLLPLSRFSHVWLCATPWMAAYQAPPSLRFSRQEYWSGLPFPSPMHACMLNCFSCVRLCAAPWTAAHQAPLSTGFSRQEYCIHINRK